MPTAAYDPGLLREQETPLVIGKNWFLDQEIPVGEIERGKEQKEREQKEGTLWAERTKQVMVEARQHQNGNE